MEPNDYNKEDVEDASQSKRRDAGDTTADGDDDEIELEATFEVFGCKS